MKKIFSKNKEKRRALKKKSIEVEYISYINIKFKFHIFEKY